MLKKSRQDPDKFRWTNTTNYELWNTEMPSLKVNVPDYLKLTDQRR